MEARTAAAPELVEALLATAGIDETWSVESVAAVGWMNANTTVLLASGERVVVRSYQWPFDAPPRYDRAAKEAWIHPLLASAGVPVAEVLATAAAAADEGARAAGALLSWLPGKTLGVVAQRVGRADLAEAWREAGAALARAHGVAVRRDVAGFLAADGEVIPMPDGSFGGFHETRMVDFAEAIAREQPELGVDPAAVAEIAALARPHIEATPLGLGHSDAHPWNVLVVPDREGRWHLSGWLDWEFAWVGDPAWDHMRMTMQRFAPIGPTPEDWFSGYGSHPPAVNLAVAVLHFMLWKAVDADDTRDRAVAHAWLADWPVHRARLHSLLA